jgi:hypothetical protein
MSVTVKIQKNVSHTHTCTKFAVMFIMYLHTKFHIHQSHGSSVTAIQHTDKYRFCTATTLLHILHIQKNFKTYYHITTTTTATTNFSGVFHIVTIGTDSTWLQPYLIWSTKSAVLSTYSEVPTSTRKQLHLTVYRSHQPTLSLDYTRKQATPQMKNAYTVW